MSQIKAIIQEIIDAATGQEIPKPVNLDLSHSAKEKEQALEAVFFTDRAIPHSILWEDATHTERDKMRMKGSIHLLTTSYMFTVEKAYSLYDWFLRTEEPA